MDESLVGRVGRVTVSLRPHHVGEVMIAIRGGSECFAATSDEEIERHAEVVVVSQTSSRSVIVSRFSL